MNFIYPCLIHCEEDGYWSEFVDFKGCFSEGDTLEEILANSKEALQSIILYNLEKEKYLPAPTPIKEIEEYEDTFKTYIDCKVLGTAKLVKKTLSIPEWVNNIGIDKGINFSKVLTEAIIREVKNN